MRYELRWSNGAWKLFDTFWYAGIQAFGLKKDAEAAVEDANLEAAKRR
jgi:hypothetical protein